MIASVVPLVGIWIILLFNVQYCCSYDTTPHQYHPSGKISQLEKATEIARRGNPVLGMIVKDGVIIISLSKLPLSKLIIKKSLFNLKTILFDKTCVLALTGQLADSRVIVDYATSRCKEHICLTLLK